MTEKPKKPKKADNTRAEVENFLGARRAVLEAMAHDHRAGCTDSSIVMEVRGAFSRNQVLEYLAAIARHDSARKALAEADLAPVVDVSVTGINPPREARLTISGNAEETPDYATLPQRIRAALHPFALTLDLPKGEHDEVTDELIDSLLLEGEPLCVVKLEPRT